MSRWFRLYEDMVNDPKVQRLPADMFKGLVNLWCIASANGGTLPSVSDIAFTLRLTEPKAAAMLSYLTGAGFIDQDGAATKPHNWDARQFKSDVSTERVKRHRNAKRNVSPTLHETPPDTETETEKDIQARGASEPKARMEFDYTFWPAYPHKVGRPSALEAFIKARRCTPLETILAGVERYVAAKPDHHEWLKPANFLNDERWNDAPAPVTARHPAKPEPAHDAIFRALAEAAADGGGRGGREADADGRLLDYRA